MNDGALLTVEFALAALIVLMVCGAVWLLLRRLSPKAVGLQPFYLRLCEIAPSSPCPCDRAANRAYADCCRPRDVESLKAYAMDYAWRQWSHRSYGGRRRSRSMTSRLEDYPIPPVQLPEWITAPDKYAFPISAEEVLRWSPLASGKPRNKAAELDDQSLTGAL